MTFTLTKADLPLNLQHVDQPPQQLYVRAQSSDDFHALMSYKRVAIVGTRKVTAYGESVTSRLAGELAAHGIVIVSGLAMGTDAIAHRAALEAGGLTLAVLPTPVENIQPRCNVNLARDIIENHGVLASEYPAGSPIYKPNFVARNRIVVGLADALLITEAAENSGTMHTAAFALKQGTTVMAVPGSILSPASAGTNNLIKSGATPVTSVKDVFHVLGIRSKPGLPAKSQSVFSKNPEEQTILDLLQQGINSGSELLSASGFSVSQFNSNLTMLEITAKIRPLGGNYWALG